MLGVLCEMGSWSHATPDYPYNLYPPLLDPQRGAGWYFEHHVDPFIQAKHR